MLSLLYFIIVAGAAVLSHYALIGLQHLADRWEDRRCTR